jgi:SnoaL-like protein
MRLFQLCVAGALLTSVVAGAAPPAAKKLNAQDYIDIKMLSARYAQIIEHCTDKGYDYAALYTPDGEFGGTNDWDVPPKKVSKGPDALAAAANGGPGGCGDPEKWMGTGLTHIIVNTVITPTATGASGRSYLVMLGVQHDPTRIVRLGGYQDTYVKTAQGWRFKTRWLVFYSGRSSSDISSSAPQSKE